MSTATVVAAGAPDDDRNAVKSLRKAMAAKASRRKVHTDQDVFDRVS